MIRLAARVIAALSYGRAHTHLYVCISTYEKKIKIKPVSTRRTILSRIIIIPDPETRTIRGGALQYPSKHALVRHIMYTTAESRCFADRHYYV